MKVMYKNLISGVSVTNATNENGTSPDNLLDGKRWNTWDFTSSGGPVYIEMTLTSPENLYGDSGVGRFFFAFNCSPSISAITVEKLDALGDGQWHQVGELRGVRERACGEDFNVIAGDSYRLNVSAQAGSIGIVFVGVAWRAGCIMYPVTRSLVDYSTVTRGVSGISYRVDRPIVRRYSIESHFGPGAVLSDGKYSFLPRARKVIDALGTRPTAWYFPEIDPNWNYSPDAADHCCFGSMLSGGIVDTGYGEAILRCDILEET